MGSPFDLHHSEHVCRRDVFEALCPRVVGIYAGEVVVVAVADEDACVGVADEGFQCRGIGAAMESGEPVADAEWVGDDDVSNAEVGKGGVKGSYQGAIGVSLETCLVLSVGKSSRLRTTRTILSTDGR